MLCSHGSRPLARIRVIVGDRVRSLRKKVGLTQAQLAERARLSEEAIGGIERGRFSPTVETLQKISGVLGVDLYELFLPERKKQGSTFEERLMRIIGSLRSRTPEELELAEDLLTTIFTHLGKRSRRGA